MNNFNKYQMSNSKCNKKKLKKINKNTIKKNSNCFKLDITWIFKTNNNT